jgi:hypothetical protein
VSESNDNPITARRLRLGWPAAIVAAGLLCGGAAWTTNMQSAIADLQEFKRAADSMLRETREDLIILRERLGVPRKEAGR